MFQFSISVILIVGTIVVSRQVDYVQSANLGYNRFNLVYLPIEGTLAQKFDVFKMQALTMSLRAFAAQSSLVFNFGLRQ